MNEKTVQVGDVLAFVRRNGVRIALRGMISLGVVIGLLALYYAFAPRTESFKAKLHVTLESRNGNLVYPNGDLFGAQDIASAPVLNTVWKKYGFDKKGLKFEDFCSWFSLVAYDKERAKIDAEFQGKMSKRNITVTELNALQKDYEAKLSTLAANQFALTVRPTRLLDRDTAVRLLNDVPGVWFEEYATIKAPTIPAVVSSEAIKTYVERSKAAGGRALELIDVIRQYLGELCATCSFIRNGIMRGRNAKVDGTDLGTYESQLAILSAEILRLKNRLLVNGGEADLGGYIAARKDDMECEKLDLDERIKAVQQTLDVIGDRKGRDIASGKSAVSAADATPVTLQADSGFFSDFTAMIRRDANQELVHKYAQELTELRKQLASLASRQLYYDQIERYLKGTAKKEAQAIAAQETQKAIDGYTTELLSVGAKVVAFRDQCLVTYRTADQFYVIAEPAAYAKSFKFTFPRFALGVLALWALYNLLAVVKLWNRE